MNPDPESNNNNNEDQDNNQEENDEEILDDDYLLQLHQYLQQMKQQRKQAELDINLLGGRLRALRDEQKKTLKKIEVTRKKTENKMNQLQQQEDQLRKKWNLKIENNKN